MTIFITLEIIVVICALTSPVLSTVIKQFYNDFPALDKSLDMCDGDIVKQDELLREWVGTADYANNKGSRVHYLLEMDLL